MSAITFLGTGAAPPTYMPALKFTDTGGSGGGGAGDRNSMYICVVVGLM